MGSLTFCMTTSVEDNGTGARGSRLATGAMACACKGLHGVTWARHMKMTEDWLALNG
jgi:hypothetical protein